MTFAEANQYLLERAQTFGIDVEVLSKQTRELSLQAFEGELEEVKQATQGGLGIRAVVNGKVGYAYSEDLRAEALDWALAEAKENAELQETSEGFLPTGQTLGSHDMVGEGLSAPLEQKRQHALDIDAQLRKDERTKQVTYSGYFEEEWSTHIASTKGVKGDYRNGITALSGMVTMQAGNSLKQGGDEDFSKEFHTLEPGKTSLKVTDRVGRLLGASGLKTGRYTAYLEPKVMTQLLSIIAYMLNAKNVVEGKSLLADKLGEPIASDKVTLVDAPQREGGLANRPFDSEGTPSQPVTLIDAGVLKGFLHNSATAKALGQTNTGHAARSYKGSLDITPTNLYIEPGAGVALEQGVLVTDVMGLHAGVNPISGDMSVQALGLMVEGGESGQAVENFTMSMNLLELLMNISAVGETLEWSFYGSAVAAPLTQVSDMSFAGA